MTGQAAARARLLLLEDHQLYAETVSVALGQAGFDLLRIPLGLAAYGAPAVVATVRERGIRVALVDVDDGPTGDGQAMIGPLAQAGVAVLALTGSRDLAEWGGCLHRGAHAVRCKNDPLADTVDVVRVLSQGGSVVSNTDRDALIAEWHHDREAADESRMRTLGYVVPELAPTAPREPAHHVSRHGHHSAVGDPADTLAGRAGRLGRLALGGLRPRRGALPG